MCHREVAAFSIRYDPNSAAPSLDLMAIARVKRGRAGGCPRDCENGVKVSQVCPDRCDSHRSHSVS